MATVHTNYCLDDFTIAITGGCDALMSVPGLFPIETTPGANYAIGFTYRTGIPNATGWHIAWTIEDDDRTAYPGEPRPSVTIAPQVPVIDNRPCELKNGTVRGAVPSPTENRLYMATLTILQA